MGRAAIFHEVLSRNALRRQARLPPLDVRAEFARMVSLAVEQEVEDLAPAHKAERQRICEQVMAESGRRTGPSGGHSWVMRMWIGSEIARRFSAYLRSIYGSTVPEPQPRHLVHYGDVAGW